MKRPQIIRMVESERLEKIVLRDDHFAFRADKKFHWLQRLCLFTLDKLGCNWSETLVSTSYHEVNVSDFVERIERQKHEVWDYLGRNPTKVLIGHDDFCQIMERTDLPHMFVNFSTEHRYNRQMVGLNVTVVPWMSGTLVMP